MTTIHKTLNCLVDCFVRVIGSVSGMRVSQIRIRIRSNRYLCTCVDVLCSVMARGGGGSGAHLVG